MPALTRASGDCLSDLSFDELNLELVEKPSSLSQKLTHAHIVAKRLSAWPSSYSNELETLDLTSDGYLPEDLTRASHTATRQKS